MTTTTLSKVREKISLILKRLSHGIYEKEEIIRLALLTAIAGESIFLLGPPGVAKSLIARRLKFAFRDGKSFEYLMNKFSTPDEIFGPVSIKKLKDEDRYERLTDNYMPGANIVFLDEIWKAGPAIQNALLTILNERIYRNGEKDTKVNIKCIVAASNELPALHEGLEALWDRFLVRTTIHEIRQSGNFISMITSTEDVYKDTLSYEEKISEEELNEWDNAINEVEVPEEVINTIQLIRLKLEEYDARNDYPFRIYDRRWKKIVRLLRTSAFLNGRNKTDLMDCFLIAYCLWNQPENMEAARQIVAETIRKHGYTMATNLTSLRKEISSFDEEVKMETKIPNPSIADELYLIDRQYYEVLNLSNYFEGKYVKSAEFERLGIEEGSTIGIYDESSKLTYKVKARKAKAEHQVDFYYNSQWINFSLRTHKVEKTTYIYKKPHPMLLNYWNERARQLEAYLKAQIDRLDAEKPKELRGINSHLFTDTRLADIVAANHKEVSNNLQSLQLNLEKTVHYYTQM